MMNCQGQFVFKSLTENKGGEFTDTKTGNLIKYGPTYSLKVDEVLEDNNVVERIFKFPIDNTTLHNKLITLDMYKKINLLFNISFYNKQIKVVPIDVYVEEN